jgi:hypothetical protein
MTSTSPNDEVLTSTESSSATETCSTGDAEKTMSDPTQLPLQSPEPTNEAPPNPDSAVPKRTLRRLNYALGPIGAGMMIDAVDFITYGPIGLILGLPVGAAAGYWLGRSMRLESHMCWICAAVAGIYCTIPGTELLPLGTLVGALVRFQDDDSVTE